MATETLPTLNQKHHQSHFTRCLRGLSGHFVEVDAARMTLAFYCVNGIDILGGIEKLPEDERKGLVEWIWDQQISGPNGESGFRPGPSTSFGTEGSEAYKTTNPYDQPHLIMTYTALIMLAVFRDDMSRLNRKGLTTFLKSLQLDDGSFTPVPGWGESDVRLLYCAFVISKLLDDWSGVDVNKALAFIRKCRSYEGGYGQEPHQEALGGTTYCAVAAYALAPPSLVSEPLTEKEKEGTIRWLAQRQIGGFQGRTGKVEDACYCFWCGAALDILGRSDVVNAPANADFLGRCQFKYGGIAKFPNENPDPYHTYMSLATLAIYPPEGDEGGSWKLPELNSVINAKAETANWALEKIKGP